MKNILVPIGISPNGQNTLEYAIALAKHFDASIFVIDSHKAVITHTHLGKAEEVINTQNFKRVKKMVQSVETKGIKIKLVEYEGSLLSGIEDLDKEIGLDLIIVGPTSNDINEKLFLGKVSGKIVKKTSIPVLLAPVGIEFSVPKHTLFAFKNGEVKGALSLEPLKEFIKKFETKTSILFVKVPGNNHSESGIDNQIIELSNDLVSTENATVYQGVLQHFDRVKPDLLTVFARKRGFFEKLMEPDVIYKKDFYSNIPLLVLKNR